MVRVPVTSRWFLATAMVVSVLLCCCTGKTAGLAFGQNLLGGSAAGHAEPAGCCSEGDSDQPTPPADDDRPCECRTHLTAKGMPDAKTVIDTAGAVPIAPVLLAWAEPGLPAVVRVAAPEGRAILRPSMSLLRQRCALII